MTDTEPITFNEAYRELWQPLPSSQRREAVKRLTTRRKDPIPAENLGDEHPEIEACLRRLSEAYSRKKVRCAASSAQRRYLRKATEAQAAEDAEPYTVIEPVAPAEPVAPVAEVVAEVAPVAEPEPEPDPEPVEAAEPAKKKAAARERKKAPAQAPAPQPAPQPVAAQAPAQRPKKELFSVEAKKAVRKALITRRP